MKKLYLIGGILILGIVATAIWLVHAKQAPKISYTIAVLKDTPAGNRAARFGNAKEISAYIDVDSMLNAVLSNDADLALTDYFTVQSPMKSQEYSDLRLINHFIELENVMAVFHRNDNTLRQAINTGLQIIINNGIYGRISRKYFGTDITDRLSSDKNQSRQITPPTDNSWLRIKQTGEMRVAFSGQVHPFSYYGEDHELAGFDVEIAESICKELGIKFTPIVYSPDEIIEGLENRYYDCFWNSSIHIDSLSKKVCFSNPYYISELRMIGKKGSKINDWVPLQ
jgi:ABC-type amino acid transport substrate-binding protein